MPDLIPLYAPIDGERMLDAAWLLAPGGLPVNRLAGYRVRLGMASNTNQVAWFADFNTAATSIPASGSVRLTGSQPARRKLSASTVLVAEVEKYGSPRLAAGLAAQLLIGCAALLPSHRAGSPALRDADDALAAFASTQAGSHVLTVPLVSPTAAVQLPSVLASDGELLTIASTSSETTLYSAAIPGWTLKPDRAIRVTLFGDYKNSTGANRTLTLRFKYGATTLYDDVTGAIATDASRRPFNISVVLACGTTMSLQNFGGNVGLGAPGGATTGIGSLDHIVALPIGGSSAIDAQVAQDFTITAQHSASDANLDIRRAHALVELI